MIQVIEQPYYIPRNEVDTQFEGRMVLIAFNSDDTESGLLVAYSDGSELTEDEDFNNLYEILQQRYSGNGKIVSGYVHDGSELVCI
ncbi:MAG: hypothetical protein FWB87_13585 [Defluviitaleaceae bacterium]|nr:hypothetical protein [Defluviitaleaceae bacterium]